MIPAMSDSSVSRVVALEDKLLELPQIEAATDHVLHAGIYARTITLPEGGVVIGALIKIDTTVIISGDVTVFVGDEPFKLCGYNVLPAMAGRKTAILAHTEAQITMLFATSVTTIEEAEEEFTNETEKLGSRKFGNVNTMITTGV